MNKEKVLLILGVWLIILPFLGFPDLWKTILISATGVVVVYLSALIWKQVRMRALNNVAEIKTETFTETS
ncbi:MAG: hypothetical protein WCG55_00995 [bacterium]